MGKYRYLQHGRKTGEEVFTADAAEAALTAAFDRLGTLLVESQLESVFGGWIPRDFQLDQFSGGVGFFIVVVH